MRWILHALKDKKYMSKELCCMCRVKYPDIYECPGQPAKHIKIFDIYQVAIAIWMLSRGCSIRCVSRLAFDIIRFVPKLSIRSGEAFTRFHKYRYPSEMVPKVGPS